MKKQMNILKETNSCFINYSIIVTKPLLLYIIYKLDFIYKLYAI